MSSEPCEPDSSPESDSEEPLFKGDYADVLNKIAANLQPSWEEEKKKRRQAEDAILLDKMGLTTSIISKDEEVKQTTLTQTITNLTNTKETRKRKTYLGHGYVEDID